MSQHAVLAYSKADRWTRCTGSVALCKDVPDTTNEAAALGTAKHQVTYWALCHTDPNKTIGASEIGGIQSADGYAFEIDQEFADHVNQCLAHVRAIPGELRLYELPLRKTVYLGLEEQGGTADVVVGDHVHRIINVGDHKFGYGKVEAEKNRQMMGYARSALEELDEFGTDYDTVRMWVFQPKRSAEPLMWECSVDELRRLTDEYREPAQEAMRAYRGEEAPKLTPGDVQCGWCPVRANCSARANRVLMAFPLELDIPITVNKTGEVELAGWLNRLDAVESWCREVRAEALRRAMAGQEIPGYKLIEGKRGNRKWIDESVAALILEGIFVDPDEYTTRKLVSPTEAEKRLKRVGKSYAEISDLVEQSAGAPSLARWDDVGKPLPRAEFGLEEAK
jgi:hypothetical protein